MAKILMTLIGASSPGTKPLSTSLLSSVLKEKGHQVILFDTTFMDLGFMLDTEVSDKITQFKKVNWNDYGLVRDKSIDPKKTFIELIKKEKPGSPINYEYIKTGSESNFRIKFKQIRQTFFATNDTFSFWKDRFSYENLFSIINDFSLKFIERELDEFEGILSLKETSLFYQNLQKEIVNSNNKSAFLCLGKGTTLMGKTILLLLSKIELQDLRNKMQYAKAARNFGWIPIYENGQRKIVSSVKLPVTRLVYKKQNNWQAGFGWIKMEEI